MGLICHIACFLVVDIAIHGSNNLPNHNASHGCIRVDPAAARWLYHNFMQVGTRVIVSTLLYIIKFINNKKEKKSSLTV